MSTIERRSGANHQADAMSVLFFMEGQDAARDGRDVNDCRYPHGSPQRTRWMQGWQAETRSGDVAG